MSYSDPPKPTVAETPRPDPLPAGAAPTDNRQPGTAKRRYTVSDKVRAANRANLAKAMAVDPKIRLRNTPRRQSARMKNIERAWARQRDPHQIPGGIFRHGACSKNLRRTAPLAGEHPDDFDRLRARLWRLFTPVTPEQQEALDKVADRLWRTRRVLGSRVHQERLMLYEALFAAAAEPGGIGLERLVKLGELVGDALDLREETLPGLIRQLRRRQSGLMQAGLGWVQAMNREWDETAGVRGRRIRDDAGSLLPPHESAGPRWDEFGEEREPGLRGPCVRRAGHAGARSTVATPRAETWGEWLARRFAEQGWKLPGGTEDDRPMHDWLVKAGVLGGDNVHESISKGLEQQIDSLANAMWDRLEELRGVCERQGEHWESNMARAEEELLGESAGAGDGESGIGSRESDVNESGEGSSESGPAPPLVDAAGVGWESANLGERLEESVTQQVRLKGALWGWEPGILDGEEVLDEVRDRNFEVRMALIGVVREVALYTAPANREQPAGELRPPGSSE